MKKSIEHYIGLVEGAIISALLYNKTYIDREIIHNYTVKINDKGDGIVFWNNIEKNKSILYEQTYYYSNTVSDTKIVKDTLEVIEIINNFLINN